ncbi:N-acetyltransferase family protein [Caryophanon latum]|uniref:GNAT family N-acetyltransferase n=1 Tax=Caryophanon latum TaxID=33977 RepID=UPI003CCBF11C
MGVDEKARGQGVGTKLFEACIAWAKEQKIHRLELTYIAHNDAAGALYNKMGFWQEGVKQHSLYIDGQYVNEYYMVLLL